LLDPEQDFASDDGNLYYMTTMRVFVAVEGMVSKFKFKVAFCDASHSALKCGATSLSKGISGTTGDFYANGIIASRLTWVG
jgi:hypothetical protein